MGLPTAKRLRTQRDFQQVRTEGKRAQCGPFILQWRKRLPEEETINRLGVIASKRVGNAVKRNRGKRLMREIFRINEGVVPRAIDAVIVLRSGYDQFSFAELEARFLKACAAIPIE
jgi:ribonuclease P protein component